ncbi:hypothetical protein ASE86_00355 [Sphingomonas sp. Leaf33]|uniref:FitA-like ribbon-helix-helix domain-containing protein n=1 Tax=Sphingomonas sp. Leaf33 TaxID=1736215 RepID=UPI0006FC0DF4|nr:hypothetical protein [Sphingomonas sp. Leaf33]KQN24789.1 hypothetical protein ASE86_00355 [Sphingomonas sp. Leaf33]
MATLTIRNFDDTLHAKWKARAKANHRSLEAEVRLALSTPTVEVDIEDMTALQQRMRAKYGPLPDSTDIIRQMRDET